MTKLLETHLARTHGVLSTIALARLVCEGVPLPLSFALFFCGSGCREKMSSSSYSDVVKVSEIGRKLKDVKLSDPQSY